MGVLTPPVRMCANPLNTPATRVEIFTFLFMSFYHIMLIYKEAMDLFSNDVFYRAPTKIWNIGTVFLPSWAQAPAPAGLR